MSNPFFILDSAKAFGKAVRKAGKEKMTDNWNKYHESKDELKIALEKHLKNIDLVHVYDNKYYDGEYGAHREYLGVSEMRDILKRLTK